MDRFKRLIAFLVALFTGSRPKPEELKGILLANPRRGKSTIRERLVAAALDRSAPRVARGLGFKPNRAMREGEGLAYPPPTTGDPVLFEGWVNCGGGPVPFTLVDAPGQLTDLLAEDAANPDNEQAVQFYDLIGICDLIILALDPEDLFEQPRERLAALLRKLGALATQAILQRRAEGKPCHVAIVFTKIDELGTAVVGSTRVAGDDRRVIRALEALQAARDEDVPGRLREFLEAAAHDPHGHDGWSALRGRLLERTAPLWEMLVRCQGLDVRALNGYFVQARPAELDDSRPTPWDEQGVLEVFRDYFDAVAQRGSPAGLRPWALAAALLVAAGLIAAGAGAAARAASIRRYAELNRDGPYDVDLRDTPRRPTLLADWRAGGLSWRAGDDVSAFEYVKLFHQTYAGFTAQLHDLSAPPAPTLAEARARLEKVHALRQQTIDRKALWDALTPEEQAVVGSNGEDGLRRYLTDFRTAQERLASAEDEVDGLLGEAAAALEVAHSSAPVAKKMDQLRAFEARRQRAREQLTRLVQDPVGGVGFLAYEGKPRAPRHANLGDDLFRPYAGLAGSAVELARAECAACLDQIARDEWEEYVRWHLAQSDAQVAFLAGLQPGANANPLARDFYAQRSAGGASSREAALCSRRLAAVVHLQDVDTGRVYLFDLTSKAVYEVTAGGVNEEPVTSSSSPARVEGTWRGLAGTAHLEVGKLAVVAVYLAPSPAPCPEGHHPVKLACRGRTTGFWLPAFLAALADGSPALTVEGIDGAGCQAQWAAFKEEMAKFQAPEFLGLSARKPGAGAPATGE
jgi:hypothetical protein